MDTSQLSISDKIIRNANVLRASITKLKAHGPEPAVIGGGFEERLNKYGSAETEMRWQLKNLPLHEVEDFVKDMNSISKEIQAAFRGIKKKIDYLGPGKSKVLPFNRKPN